MKFMKVLSCIIALIFTIGCPTENQVITPTTSTNRMAAEWEPVIGSIIAWPVIIPKPLVIELAKGKMLLYVMVSDEIDRLRPHFFSANQVLKGVLRTMKPKNLKQG